MTAAISPSRWSVVLEATDADKLAEFYVALLGWGFRTREEGWVTVGPGAEGPDYLAFSTSREYRRPVWPPADGEQQMMLHLDFCVGDSVEALDEAADRAREVGAVDSEYQPNDEVRVMLDPDGHPFCLYID